MNLLLYYQNKYLYFLLFSRRPYIDKSETQPFLQTATTTTSASLSPTATAPIMSGTSTINRTLLHHQNLNTSTTSVPTSGRSNGTMRGLEISTNGESPPPDYNFVMHGIRHASFL